MTLELFQCSFRRSYQASLTVYIVSYVHSIEPVLYHFCCSLEIFSPWMFDFLWNSSGKVEKVSKNVTGKKCEIFFTKILFSKNIYVLSVQWSKKRSRLWANCCSNCFIQVKLTKISYIGALFKAWFTHDSGVFRVQFR